MHIESMAGYSLFFQVEEKSQRVYVGDFGLSQIVSGTTRIGTKTMLAGSPGFQSPEQLRGESIGLPSDVYALGTVLLVLFGETTVWPGLAPFQIIYKVTLCNEAPPTAHLLPEIQMLCNACFVEKSNRPPANTLLQRLLQLIQ